jgi:predicted RNase H-like HicB family nuclease
MMVRALILTTLMSIKLRDVQTRVIKEKDGSYAIACSALGVYSVGKTMEEAKANFEEALELHLSALREKAIEAVA